jgi:hypothetical protein
VKFLERNKRRKLTTDNRKGKRDGTRKENFIRENQRKEKSVVK